MTIMLGYEDDATSSITATVLGCDGLQVCRWVCPIGHHCCKGGGCYHYYCVR